MTLTRTTALLLCTLSGSAIADLETPSATHVRPEAEYFTMIPAHGGGVYALGNDRSGPSSEYDVVIERLSSDLDSAWSIVMAGSQDSNDSLLDAAPDHDGGLVVLASLRNINEDGHFRTHVQTSRITPDGEVAWTHSTDSLGLSGSWPSAEKARVATSVDGRTCIMENVVYESLQLRSLDAYGNLEWDNNYALEGITNTIIGLEVAMNDAGETLIAGLIAGGDSHGKFALSIAPDGTHQWTIFFNSEGPWSGDGCLAKVNSEGNWVLVCDSTMAETSEMEIFAACITPSGNLNWQSYYDEAGKSLDLKDFDVNADDDVIVGTTSRFNNGEGWVYSQVLIKFDSNGTLDWTKKYFAPNTIDNNSISAVTCDSDGSIYVAGTFVDEAGSVAQLCTTMNASGAPTRSTTWDPSQNGDVPNDVSIDTNGQIYVCGRANPNGSSYHFDATVMKVTNCPADIDGNGAVNITDLLTLLSAYGTDDSASDLDDDGIVGVLDLLMVLDNWNGCES